MSLLTTILGSDAIRNSRSWINENFTVLYNALIQKTTITIGTSAGADYVCDGTNDGAVIQLAITALPAGGGKLFFRNGTYNWDVTADRCVLAKSNVVIEGETYGGVIFKATATLHPGGSNAQGRYGIFSIGKSQTSKISDIIIRNIVFDCNNVAKTAGLTLDGGSGLTGQIGLQNVLVENVRVKNHASSSSDGVEAGLFCISGNTQAFGSTKGYLDKITFRNVDVGNANIHGWWFLGGHFTNILIEDSWIHDCNRNGIEYFNYDGSPTSSDWTLKRVRFERNMILTSGSSQANFRDEQQTGIENLTVDDCYFGPTQNPSTTQDYDLTPYWAGNLRITNCLFDRGGAGVSLGTSIAGAYSKIFPISRLIFENNIMYQMRSCFDNDSNVHAVYRGNTFYECKTSPILAPYSRHFPTTYEDNLIYNCHTDEITASSSSTRSVFRVNGDGFIIKNNTVIDDRKLLNPTSSLTLSQKAGGALSARTYYIKYTWANDTGETLPSTQQSIAVSANNIVTIAVGFSFIPSGAKSLKIYVSTTSGAETLQTTISLPAKVLSWTEPTSGLVSGAALPSSNTTDTKTKFGIYEIAGGASGTFGNVYHNNHFIGIETPIRKDPSYKRISYDNYSDLTRTGGDEVNLEKQPYSQGNVTGATTFNVINGEYITATLEGVR